MRTDPSLSENNSFQVSHTLLDVPALGVELRYSCKNSEASFHYLALRCHGDVEFTHVDVRKLPKVDSRIQSPTSVKERLRWFEELLVANFDSPASFREFLMMYVAKAQVAMAGEMLIRAAAALGALPRETQHFVNTKTDGKLYDCLAMAIQGAAEISPSVKASLKTHPPAGFPGLGAIA